MNTGSPVADVTEMLICLLNVVMGIALDVTNSLLHPSQPHASQPGIVCFEVTARNPTWESG